MRYRSLFIGLVFALVCGPGLAAEKNTVDAEIREVINAQVAAWNRGDIDGFMDGYVRSDTLEFVSGGKITRGWQTVRDRYRKKYDSRETMGTLKFSDIKITMLKSNIATVLGRWEL